MRIVLLTAIQCWRMIIKGRVLIPIYLIWLLLIVYAVYTGYRGYTVQQIMAAAYQQKARESWEANPDKHPHRMAHFGSFAFRIKHPLSMFDKGMESYTGNAIYLEAHKQNTVNFSEAGFSTGLLRFGELSLSMLLQLLLPLILFFLGFSCIAAQRENGTLKILLSQGAGFRQIIFGYSTGLFVVSLLFLIPVMFTMLILLNLKLPSSDQSGLLIRCGIITIAVLIYMWVVSVIAVCVSAASANSRAALLKLLGIWLFFCVVFPKTVQAAGSYLYPAPGKIEFETQVEANLLRLGDSHNPEDPYFRRLKDSVLKANRVDSIQQLTFNYSGFQMMEGERMSAETYNRHLHQLFAIYDKQNNLSELTGFFNPYMGLKHLSMAFSGTDFRAYRHFQEQAELYRYQLAQTMNGLQMEYISNRPPPPDKPHRIDKHHWSDFPDFRFAFPQTGSLFKLHSGSMAAMAAWVLLSLLIVILTSRNAKAI